MTMVLAPVRNADRVEEDVADEDVAVETNEDVEAVADEVIVVEATDE